MSVYKTPGVYVEEISTLPASVAQVETAIPAFIGYTALASDRGESLSNVPTRIKSMPEFRQLFGGEPPINNVDVTLNASNGVDGVSVTDPANRYYLFDSVRLFYDNGGGPCYIISVGDYDDAPAVGANNSSGIRGGLAKLAKEDEPTMILFPDAAGLSEANLATLQQLALKQCNTLQDRVAVMDLKESPTGDPNWQNGVDKFRDAIGINYLKYGAAYTPWLKANYPKRITFRKLTLKRGADTVALTDLTEDEAVLGAVDVLEQAIANRDTVTTNIATLRGTSVTLGAQYQELVKAATASATKPNVTKVFNFLRDLALAADEWFHGQTDATKKLDGPINSSVSDAIGEQMKAALADLIAIHKGAADGTIDIVSVLAADHYHPFGYANSPWGLADNAAVDAVAADTTKFGAAGSNAAAHYKGALKHLKKILAAMAAGIAAVDLSTSDAEATAETALKELFPVYKQIVDTVSMSLTRVPPSGAIAGVYASVDRDRGVWKAPANVSLSAVVGLSEHIDFEDQKGLNVDVTAGKSINAIRKFTGKGFLVWGARTLAGNDNEWRYVSVRRFYNMVEESIEKSSGWVVFEPNAPATWVRVKAMIENYLTGLWRDGALMGSKPDQAFFVNVGLGTTMTAVDILEGRMIIEVGMAVVRPAEFIILRFMHKMPEA